MAVQVKEREQQDVETEQLMSGCEAIAEAIRLADVDVMAAYPIRPYDGVMQAAAKLIANGKMDVEYIVADGEHSQFEIVKHACAVGSRVFVGSSGVGWFYAFEAIAVTAGLRLPVVAICGNRALDDPGRREQVPAALRPRRPAPSPRQSDHHRAAGRPGLAHGDPHAERPGDAEGARCGQRSARRVQKALRPWRRQSVPGRVHDR